jgi:hypothetical protein
MPRTISRTIDNPSPVQGPGLMSWLGDGVASPPARMREPIVLTDASARDAQRSSAWRTVINMKMKSRGEPTSPIVATIASSFISSAVTWCARSNCGAVRNSSQADFRPSFSFDASMSTTPGFASTNTSRRSRPNTPARFSPTSKRQSKANGNPTRRPFARSINMRAMACSRDEKRRTTITLAAKVKRTRRPTPC